MGIRGGRGSVVPFRTSTCIWTILKAIWSYVSHIIEQKVIRSYKEEAWPKDGQEGCKVYPFLRYDPAELIGSLLHPLIGSLLQTSIRPLPYYISEPYLLRKYELIKKSWVVPRTIVPISYSCSLPVNRHGKECHICGCTIAGLVRRYRRGLLGGLVRRAALAILTLNAR